MKAWKGFRKANGVMGVPFTFLFKWNPSQFDIVGGYCIQPKINGKTKFTRLFIKRH